MKYPLFLCCCLLMTAASASNDSLAHTLAEQAWAYAEALEPDSARIYADSAACLYQDANELAGYIGLHKQLGRIYREQQAYGLARPEYELALYQRWRTPETRDEFHQLAWTNAGLGYLYKKMNNFRQAAFYYERSAVIFRDSLEEEGADVAWYIYSELGNAYSRLREYPKAEHYLKRRRDILLVDPKYEVQGACNDLGVLYNNWEKPDKAIEALEGGLLQAGEDDFLNILLLTNLGLAYYHQGNYPKARQKTQECETLIRKSPYSQEEKDGMLVDVHENYAVIAKAEQDYPNSKNHYGHALALARRVEPENRRVPALLLIGRGDLYRQMGKPGLGLQDYQAAIQLFLPDFEPADENSQPAVAQLIAEPNLLDALGGKARCFREMNEPVFLSLALECYERAGEVERLLHELYILEGARLAALKEHRWIREEAMAVAFEQYTEKRSPALEATLLSLSERNRAMLLMENLAMNRQASGQMEGLGARYFEQAEKINALEEAVYRERQKPAGKPARLDSLNQQLLNEKEARAKMARQALASQPGWQGASINDPLAVRDIQEELGAGRMLVEYFLGEEQLYLMAITEEGLQVWQKSYPPDFRLWAETLKTSLTDAPIQNLRKYQADFAVAAFQLYRFLLEDALDWAPAGTHRLAIVTDGILGYIPFELLLREMPEGDFYYGGLDYLLRHYSISYAPSARLFLQQSAKRPGSAPRVFAGFAPDYQVKEDRDTADQLVALLVREGEYELKGAREEVLRVGSLLGGETFIGPKASEAAFKREAAAFQILLLAMHSLVEEDNPSFSRLLFTKGAGSPEEDNRLHALELSALFLQADLAFLSACNTGYGKLYEGEGVMSLSRAFFLAGVPSTVMTLWKVPDAYSPGIVIAFFNNLKAGLPKDVALQRAKLAYLGQVATPEEAHPYFWAGFITAGNTEALELEPSRWEGMLPGALLVLFLLLGLFGWARWGN